MELDFCGFIWDLESFVEIKTNHNMKFVKSSFVNVVVSFLLKINIYDASKMSKN